MRVSFLSIRCRRQKIVVKKSSSIDKFANSELVMRFPDFEIAARDETAMILAMRLQWRRKKIAKRNETHCRDQSRDSCQYKSMRTCMQFVTY